VHVMITFAKFYFADTNILHDLPAASVQYSCINLHLKIQFINIGTLMSQETTCWCVLLFDLLSPAVASVVPMSSYVHS